jgi:hypothetical protein
MQELQQLLNRAITDLGPRPGPNTKEIVPFCYRRCVSKHNRWLCGGSIEWLQVINGLTEKMTWFWHGHWATSVRKA